MRFFLPLFFALAALGQPNPPPDTNAPPDPACVAFIDNPDVAQKSTDLTSWNDVAIVPSNTSTNVTPGFYRARVQ